MNGIVAARKLLSRVARETKLYTTDWRISNLMVEELSNVAEAKLFDWSDIRACPHLTAYERVRGAKMSLLKGMRDLTTERPAGSRCCGVLKNMAIIVSQWWPAGHFWNNELNELGVPSIVDVEHLRDRFDLMVLLY